MNHIPSYLSEIEQRELFRLTYPYNSPDCVGVEIGSCHGRSSYAISLAINKGKLYCIDLWLGFTTGLYNDKGIETNNTLELFLEYTKGRDNIIPIRGELPDCVGDWTQPIDFVFLDASHKNPGDRIAIDFWLPKLKPGGMFAGHDWFQDRGYPDVNTNVEYMEDLLKQKVTIIPRTSIWYFKLPKI